MGDAGEGLIDAQNRIQERMDEREEERARRAMPQGDRDPEQLRRTESLRLAYTELSRQLRSHDTHHTAPAAVERARRTRASTQGSRRASALAVLAARGLRSAASPRAASSDFASFVVECRGFERRRSCCVNPPNWIALAVRLRNPSQAETPRAAWGIGPRASGGCGARGPRDP